METDEVVQIEYTTRFQRDVRTLAKRYRDIRTDLQPLLDRLQDGETPGDLVPGINYTVFKVRV